MTSQEEFRVLLVGAGEQGWESRGPSIQKLPPDMNVVLAAIADPDARQLAWTARRLGVERTYPTMTDALSAERFHGTILAAPNHLHEPLALEAFEAELHVLVEKPIALDAAGGRRMLEASRAANKVLEIGYQYPWMHPGLFDLADAGLLDSVFHGEGHWKRARIARNRSNLNAKDDLLGHLLSVLQIGIRAKPLWVTALWWSDFGRRAHGEAFRGHDTLEVTIVFEGGKTAHLFIGLDMNQPMEESIGIKFDGIDLSIDVPLMGRELDVERFMPEINGRVGNARLGGKLRDPLPVQTEDTFVLQAQDWVEACRGVKPLRFPPEDALVNQAILDAVGVSAEAGGPPAAVEL